MESKAIKATALLFILFTLNTSIALAQTGEPDAITDLSATAGNTEVDLTWTEPNDNGSPITDYEIHYSSDAFILEDLTFDDGVSIETSITVTGLTNEIPYYFRVYAINEEGTGPQSNMADAKPSKCTALGPNSFCAVQDISGQSTLSFTSVPTSFDFPSIVLSGSPQDIFNNNTPPHVNEPGADDEITVFDDRISGGFEVQVDIDGDFTDGTNTIPDDNLYTVTSLDESDPNNVGGVTYSSGFSGPQTVSAPLYVDVDDPGCIDCLQDSTTYTNFSPDSRFGSGALVLMDGGLPSIRGRDGSMSVYTNFYLLVPALQPPGTYAAIVTYTLLDDTT